MTRLDAMKEGYLLATGKSVLPDVNSTKYSKLLGLCLKLYRDWQTEPDVDWESLYVLATAGIVTATDTFTVSNGTLGINKLSKRPNDYIYVQPLPSLATGKIRFYSTTPQRLALYTNGVAQSGQNQIKFSRPFLATDQALGGTIYVPAIGKLPDLATNDSLVLINNPAWLPAMLAAEYVHTDSQLNYLYEDLLDAANDIMEGMIDDNNPIDASSSTGEDYFSTTGPGGGNGFNIGGSNSGSIWQ